MFQPIYPEPTAVQKLGSTRRWVQQTSGDYKLTDLRKDNSGKRVCVGGLYKVAGGYIGYIKSKYVRDPVRNMDVLSLEDGFKAVEEELDES